MSKHSDEFRADLQEYIAHKFARRSQLQDTADARVAMVGMARIMNDAAVRSPLAEYQYDWITKGDLK